MDRNKLSIIFASIGIVLVSLVMIVSTYAYFTVDLESKNSDIIVKTLDENVNVIFTDTSNVSLVNAYTGDSIEKEFTVENVSNYDIYYDIKLNNVVNNFENKEDLVYELTSEDDAAIRNTSIVPSQDELIASYIKLEKGKKHTYKFKITFLSKDKDQSDNSNKTFSSNIVVKSSDNINIGENIYKPNSILEYMVKNSKKYDYSVNSDQDGIYYTNSSINGTTIYFYRGTNKLNNNIVLGDNCYKILRTTSDFGIKIIYNGKYENNACTEKQIIDTLSSYNIRSNYNAYVGYMYGNPSSDNYNSEHENITSSTIKEALESWYNTEIKKYADKLSDKAIYCNNRKTSEFIIKKVLYGKLGYGNANTGYYSYNNTNFTFDCYNLKDRFSVNSSYGENVLNYPVGLITLDELKMAGFDINYNFLHSKYSYYTMSPAYFNGIDAYMFIVDRYFIKDSKVNQELGIRPVLTLNKDIIINGGDGSLNSPFIIN